MFYETLKPQVVEKQQSASFKYALASPSSVDNMAEYQRELEVAKALARAAGLAILEVYHSSFSVDVKADQSPITQADLHSNSIIIKGLRNAFAHDAILTEEQEDDKIRFTKSRVWIIDPLDGTKEFVKRNGQFAVSIGLCVEGKPVLGVIYAPVLDELYYSVEAQGAFLESQGRTERLQVSTKKRLAEAIVVRSGSSKDERIQRFDDLVKSKISIGSALKGCLVARSHADFYPRFENLWEWDVCAMHHIVKEAGGTITSLDGSAITYNHEHPRMSHGFVISNGALHEQILEVMRNG